MKLMLVRKIQSSCPQDFKAVNCLSQVIECVIPWALASVSALICLQHAYLLSSYRSFNDAVYVWISPVVGDITSEAVFDSFVKK